MFKSKKKFIVIFEASICLLILENEKTSTQQSAISYLFENANLDFIFIWLMIVGIFLILETFQHCFLGFM